MDIDSGLGKKGVEMAVLMTVLANFSLIGTIGNGLVIFVFQRVREKTTAQVFMIFLAVIDLFTCTVIIPLTMFMEYSRYHIEYNALCKMYHFLITSKIPLSALIMVAIAVDRYFCICHPLTKAITIARARLIIVGFVCLASVFGLITSFFHGVMVVTNRVDNNRIFQLIGTNNTLMIMNITDAEQQIEEIKKRVAEEVLRRNMTVDWDVNTSLPRYEELVNVGTCHNTFLHLSHDSFRKYKIIYHAVFPTCLIIVIVLYFLIYRFMCLRRSKKLKQRLKMCSYVNQSGGVSNGTNGLTARDDDNGYVTELSALSQSPILNKPKFSKVDGKNNTNPNDEESRAKLLNKETSLSDEGKQFLSPPTSRQIKHGLSSSCSTLNVPIDSEGRTVTDELSLTPSSSCSQIVRSSDNGNSNSTSALTPSSPTTSPTAAVGHLNNSETDRKSGVGHIRHQQYNKIRQYKKQESIKRYKNKKRALLKDKQRNTSQSRDFDPGRLRDENRRANVRTALMLFTVNIVFVIAFGPAWLMTLEVLPDQHIIFFYLYFIYNAANPFIYAFMNHIFKAYMRNIFTCKRKAMVVVSS